MIKLSDYLDYLNNEIIQARKSRRKCGNDRKRIC
jgi:hypothetical protein